jgi:hypothetical protein
MIPYTKFVWYSVFGIFIAKLIVLAHASFCFQILVAIRSGVRIGMKVAQMVSDLGQIAPTLRKHVNDFA